MSAQAPTVGEVLTTTNGTWTNSPTGYTYQWLQDGITSIGSNQNTYTVQQSDVGHTIDVAVTATNASGATTATAVQTGIVTSGLLPLADPTFVGNSQPAGGDASSGMNHNAPFFSSLFGVADAAVNSTGQFVTSSLTQEHNHMLGGYASDGTPVGFAPLMQGGNGGNGIHAVAIDGTYLYYINTGRLYRYDFGSLGFFSKQNTVTNNFYPSDYIIVNAAYSGSLYYIGLCVTPSWLYLVDPVSFDDAPTTTNVPSVSARIVPVSTTWTGTTGGQMSATIGTAWVVPRARSIAADRQGKLWVMQQALQSTPGTNASTAGILSRWDPANTSAALQSFTLPTSVYPMDIWCDPNSDILYVADNGRDQNFKKYAYDNNNVSPLAPTTSGPISGSTTIGVQNGYLDSTSGTPGVLGPQRFAGPRAIAVDSSGNILTGQNGSPGGGDSAWYDNGTMAIVSLMNSSGVEQWRNWAADYAGNGEACDDGTRFYSRVLSYARTNTDINGAKIYRGFSGVSSLSDPSWLGTHSQYIPYAFTADPWTNSATEDRCSYNAPCNPVSAGAYSGGGHPQSITGSTAVRVVEGSNGHRYLFMWGGLLDGRLFTNFCFRVYTLTGEIATCSTVFRPDGIYKQGVKVYTLSIGGGSQGGWWVEPNMNVWFTSNNKNLYRFRFQGFAASDGVTPLWDTGGSATGAGGSVVMDTFSAPSEISAVPIYVRAYGSTVWATGFGSGDPTYANGNAQYGRMCRYDGVSTTGGGSFPAATWSVVPTGWTQGSPPDIGQQVWSFGVSPSQNRVVVGWQAGSLASWSPNLSPAWVQFYQDNGAGGCTYMSGDDWNEPSGNTSSSVWGVAGVIDCAMGIMVKDGYVWFEDDKNCHFFGKALP